MNCTALIVVICDTGEAASRKNHLRFSFFSNYCRKSLVSVIGHDQRACSWPHPVVM